jgi:hypothetical protein
LSYYAKQYRQTQEAIKAAQAPVIFNTPFAQESIDQGVTVISREHPVYQSTEDPEAQALSILNPISLPNESNSMTQDLKKPWIFRSSASKTTPSAIPINFISNKITGCCSSLVTPIVATLFQSPYRYITSTTL